MSIYPEIQKQTVLMLTVTFNQESHIPLEKTIDVDIILISKKKNKNLYWENLGVSKVCLGLFPLESS